MRRRLSTPYLWSQIENNLPEGKGVIFASICNPGGEDGQISQEVWLLSFLKSILGLFGLVCDHQRSLCLGQKVVALSLVRVGRSWYLASYLCSRCVDGWNPPKKTCWDRHPGHPGRERHKQQAQVVQDLWGSAITSGTYASCLVPPTQAEDYIASL